MFPLASRTRAMPLSFLQRPEPNWFAQELKVHAGILTSTGDSANSAEQSLYSLRKALKAGCLLLCSNTGDTELDSHKFCPIYLRGSSRSPSRFSMSRTSDSLSSL